MITEIDFAKEVRKNPDPFGLQLVLAAPEMDKLAAVVELGVRKGLAKMASQPGVDSTRKTNELKMAVGQELKGISKELNINDLDRAFDTSTFISSIISRL